VPILRALSGGTGCAGPVDLVGGGNPSGQKLPRELVESILETEVGRLNKPPVGADIVPDAHWPDMWRVTRADGSLSDMMSLARAKDAALAIADDSWAKMSGSKTMEAPPLSNNEPPDDPGGPAPLPQPAGCTGAAC
jgi:hypothetical protein